METVLVIILVCLILIAIASMSLLGDNGLNLKVTLVKFLVYSLLFVATLVVVYLCLSLQRWH